MPIAKRCKKCVRPGATFVVSWLLLARPGAPSSDALVPIVAYDGTKTQGSPKTPKRLQVARRWDCDWAGFATRPSMNDSKKRLVTGCYSSMPQWPRMASPGSPSSVPVPREVSPWDDAPEGKR